MQINTEKEFLELFISELNKEYKYCILRNYEEYPNKIGNDIDILILIANTEDLLTKIRSFFNENKITVKVKKINKTFLSIICFYYDINDSIKSIQIDFWTKFEWRGIKWIDEDNIIKNRIKYNSFFIPANGTEAAITILKEMVVGGKVKEKYYKKLTEKVKKDQLNFYNSLYPILGKYTIKITEHIEFSAFEKINKEQRAIRNRLRLKHPLIYLYHTISKIPEKLISIVSPKGKLITFIGPDGSGKTTFIDLTQEHFEKLYSGVKRYHIRFNILPELKTGRGISSMKGEINKKSVQNIKRSFISKCASWFVVLYYTLEFFIGRTPLRRYKKKNYLILYDRYYYDFFVQPTTRKLIYSFRKILLLFIKKPDIIIHLDANAKTVYQRKQELSIDEIETQNKILEELLKNSKNVYRIQNDNKTINEIDKEIFTILLRGL